MNKKQLDINSKREMAANGILVSNGYLQLTNQEMLIRSKANDIKAMLKEVMSKKDEEAKASNE